MQAGSPILQDGQDSPHIYTILSGWAMRSKTFEDGRRQVLNFALVGDLIGLQSVLFDKMHHTVEALSDARLCVFSRQRLWELYQEHPALGFDITWLAAREEQMLADHLANIGQRSAFVRLAYMIIHLFDRARRAGVVKGKRLAAPITQDQLADAMGLSLVHTNKMLKRLRDAGWVEFKRNEITILDEVKLAEAADYDLGERPARPFI